MENMVVDDLRGKENKHEVIQHRLHHRADTPGQEAAETVEQQRRDKAIQRDQDERRIKKALAGRRAQDAFVPENVQEEKQQQPFARVVLAAVAPEPTHAARRLVRTHGLNLFHVRFRSFSFFFIRLRRCPQSALLYLILFRL